MSPPPAFPTGAASSAEALALFDALPPVDTRFMHGSWRGREFSSGHPLDGTLASYGWRGKRFDGDELAHPLLFGSGGREFAVRPAWLLPALPLVLRWPALKREALARWLRPGLRLLATPHSRARLRMLQFRGQLGAAMVYDDVPIVDVFRQVDHRTVLGLMDLKGMEAPFFFVLQRRPG